MTQTFSSLFGKYRRVVPLAAGLVLILAAGLVHGLWTDRWGDGADLEAAAVRLRQVPRAFDDWTGHDQDLDPERLVRAEAAGHLGLTYRKGPGSQAVSVVLLCGRFGPLSVHTPDLCYGGAGYEMLGTPVRHAVPLDNAGTAEVWTARFHKPSTPGDPPLRVCWAWSAGKEWRAPGLPRWTFRREPLLYKLYVSREMARLDEPLEDDPCFTFLGAWLPRIAGILFDTSNEKGIAR